MVQIKKTGEGYFEISDGENVFYFGRNKHDYFFDFSEMLKKSGVTIDDIKSGNSVVTFMISIESEVYPIFRKWNSALYENVVKDRTKRALSQHYIDEDGDVVIESSDADTTFREGIDNETKNRLTVLNFNSAMYFMFTAVHPQASIRIDSIGAVSSEEYMPTHTLLGDLENYVLAAKV